MNSDSAPTRPTFREVLREREYRVVFMADVASQLGDQLAAVALAVLVYGRSHSPLLAGLAYATIFLPWVVGGPVLAAIADRFPARRVLATVDLTRAGLIGIAAIPGLPLPLLGLMVLTAAMTGPAFRSARAALVPQLLTGDQYAVGLSLQEALHQSAQLVGFVAGGALVVLLTAPGALAVDAATFLFSGLWLLRGVRSRPPALAKERRTSLLRESRDAYRVIAADPRLRKPLLLSIIGSAYVLVPEAIAPAFAHDLGGGPVTVGLLMAAAAAGALMGSIAMGRWLTSATRLRLMQPLAVCGALPLLLAALRPGLDISLVLFLLAGACTAFQVPANAAFAAAVPAESRARAFGLAMTALMGGQLVSVVLSSAAAQLLAPSTVIGAAGALGLLAVLLASHNPLRRRNALRPTPALAPAAN